MRGPQKKKGVALGQYGVDQERRGEGELTKGKKITLQTIAGRGPPYRNERD